MALDSICVSCFIDINMNLLKVRIGGSVYKINFHLGDFIKYSKWNWRCCICIVLIFHGLSKVSNWTWYVIWLKEIRACTFLVFN